MIPILLLFQLVSAGNILVFNPTMGHSHVKFLGNLADLLAEDGHNVTVLSVVIDETVKPFGTSNPNVHKVVFHSPYINVTGFEELDIKGPQFWDIPEPDGMFNNFEDWELWMGSYTAMYKGLLDDKAFLQTMKDSKFDLGITELFDMSVMGYFELLNIKSSMVAAALGMISFHYDISGIPAFPSFVPGWVVTYSENMSFMQRMWNLKIERDLRAFQYDYVAKYQKLYEERYPGFPSLIDLSSAKTGVILSNANEFTESPRPFSNMFQYVGGTNVHPPKPLDKEMNNILDLRPSTVLFSLGSFTKSCNMPLKLKKEILNAFASFPDVTFLWKYEECSNDTTPFSDYPNVIPRSWLPQTDLLGDSRLKAFITHAGMNSMLEAAFRGKPTITIPLFADQYINAHNAANRGISILLQRTHLSETTLKEALGKVLSPESPVAKKAAMASAVLKGKDEEYRNAVKRWARLLIEFGPMEHLRLPSRNLHFLQIYSVDVILFVVFVIVCIILFAWYLSKLAYNMMAYTNKKQKAL